MFKQPYIITKSVHEILELDRLACLSRLVKKYKIKNLYAYELDSGVEYERSTAYLIGGIGNRITHLFKCDNRAGGCCIMPTISVKDFSGGMFYFAKNKVDLIGLARVTQVHSRHTGGTGMGDFSKQCGGRSLLLTFARDGMVLEKIGHEYVRSDKYYVGKFSKLPLEIEKD